MFNMTCKEKEMDFELKMAKAKEKAKQQPTLMDLCIEINRLKLENECLKADKSELIKENEQLKIDIDELHNELEVKQNTEDTSMLNEYEEEYLCGCESEEDFDAYAEALNNCSLPTVD